METDDVNVFKFSGSRICAYILTFVLLVVVTGGIAVLDVMTFVNGKNVGSYMIGIGLIAIHISSIFGFARISYQMSFVYTTFVDKNCGLITTISKPSFCCVCINNYKQENVNMNQIESTELIPNSCCSGKRQGYFFRLVNGERKRSPADVLTTDIIKMIRLVDEYRTAHQNLNSNSIPLPGSAVRLDAHPTQSVSLSLTPQTLSHPFAHDAQPQVPYPSQPLNTEPQVANPLDAQSPAGHSPHSKETELQLHVTSTLDDIVEDA